MRTDRRTDRILIARLCLHSMQHGKNEQVDQLSQRYHAAGWVSYGQQPMLLRKKSAIDTGSALQPITQLS